MAAALADPRTGTMAAARGRRLVELPRRTHQHRGPEHLPASRRKPVAARAPAPKPEGLHDVGEDARDHRPLAALATHPPSLASNTFRRQTSKAGAGCLNRARPVLCGGRSVMSVPTAILHFSPSAGSLRRRAAATPRKLSAGLRRAFHNRTKQKGWTHDLFLDLAFKFSLSPLEPSQFVPKIRNLPGDDPQFSLGLFARQVV